MTDVIIEMIKAWPQGATALIGLLIVAGVFHAGIAWTSFRQMVTKQYLEIALLKLEQRLDAKYLRTHMAHGDD